MVPRVGLVDLGVIKGSTGRSDDFCTPAVPELTWREHRPTERASASGRPPVG
jgi:hypothetical protein